MLKLIAPSYNKDVISRKRDNYDVNYSDIPQSPDKSIATGTDIDNVHNKPIPFDQRRIPRVFTRGWVRIICCDPFRSFIGGTSRIIDINDTSIGVISKSKIEIGELLEVQMAPFKVRGRLGTVIRCDKLSGYNCNSNEQVYKIAVKFGNQKNAA